MKTQLPYGVSIFFFASSVAAVSQLKCSDSRSLNIIFCELTIPLAEFDGYHVE